MAVLTIYFKRAEYDLWLDGSYAGSMMQIVKKQIAAQLEITNRLPADFDQRLALTGFELPADSGVTFSVMEQKQGLRKLSDIRLLYTPDQSIDNQQEDMGATNDNLQALTLGSQQAAMGRDGYRSQA